VFVVDAHTATSLQRTVSIGDKPVCRSSRKLFQVGPSVSTKLLRTKVLRMVSGVRQEMRDTTIFTAG
jgi:hypothetical protein